MLVVILRAVKMKAAFGYDDALDVVGVHGVGGTIGAFATGLYCTKFVMGPDGVDGLFIGWGSYRVLTSWDYKCVGFLCYMGLCIYCDYSCLSDSQIHNRLKDN